MYKKTIITFLLFISFISCKAQIVNIEDECFGTSSNTYYKDINNLLNPYEGTWKYQNGNEILIVKLRKVLNTATSTTADVIIGEYQYIDANGVEKINTLSNFDVNNIAQSFHTIFGHCINNYTEPVCDICLPNTKRVVLVYGDPLKDVSGEFYMGKAIVGGNEAIKMFIKTDGNKVNTNGSDVYSDFIFEYVGVTIPKGWYTLIKQ